jgi:hypothetical protein
MSVTTDPAHTSIPELAASTSAGSLARRVRLRWVALHFVPLLLVPLLTTSLGPVIGLDGAAIATHAATIVLIALGEGTLLERISIDAAWKRRAMLAVAAAIATAMIVMSTVDLAGYDLLATPVAMTLGGLAQGIILGWPVRRVGAAARWATASALGWLAGAGAYRLGLSELLALEIGTRSLYGYAYTGGHNELLWIACGIACFGLATAFVVHPASRDARCA